MKIFKFLVVMGLCSGCGMLNHVKQNNAPVSSSNRRMNAKNALKNYSQTAPAGAFSANGQKLVLIAEVLEPEFYAATSLKVEPTIALGELSVSWKVSKFPHADDSANPTPSLTTQLEKVPTALVYAEKDPQNASMIRLLVDVASTAQVWDESTSESLLYDRGEYCSDYKATTTYHNAMGDDVPARFTGTCDAFGNCSAFEVRGRDINPIRTSIGNVRGSTTSFTCTSIPNPIGYRKQMTVMNSKIAGNYEISVFENLTNGFETQISIPSFNEKD